MNDEHSRTAPGQLTDSQATRFDCARRDLHYSRTDDLSQLEAAGLILHIERLRRRLDDMLDLVVEVADPSLTPPTPPPKRLCGPTLFIRDHAH